MLIFPCRHDEPNSHDVITFKDPAFGWQRTVRLSGGVSKWRQVRLLWEAEDVEFNREWPTDDEDDAYGWAWDDARVWTWGQWPLSTSAEVCHYEQDSKWQ